MLSAVQLLHLEMTKSRSRESDICRRWHQPKEARKKQHSDWSLHVDLDDLQCSSRILNKRGCLHLFQDIADFLPHLFTNFGHEQDQWKQDHSDIESDLDVVGPQSLHKQIYFPKMPTSGNRRAWGKGHSSHLKQVKGIWHWKCLEESKKLKKINFYF